jgi:hypothetical protein
MRCRDEHRKNARGSTSSTRATSRCRDRPRRMVLTVYYLVRREDVYVKDVHLSRFILRDIRNGITMLAHIDSMTLHPIDTFFGMLHGLSGTCRGVYGGW